MFTKKPPTRPTFVSFVENTTGEDVSSSPSLPDSSDQSDTTPFNSPVNFNQNDEALDLKLLSGEIIVLKVPHVTRFLSFSDGGSAVFGSIIVTNFRVAFISLNGDSGLEDNYYKCQLWSHKFIRKDDILLTNISEIYQVGKNKRRKLEKGINVSDSMSKLEIYCRDFRVHCFSLLSREGHSMTKLVASITQFVFPSRHELLFANSFRGPFASPGFRSSILLFHDRYDWATELNEFNAAGFRVTTCNAGFAFAESLPPCFAVPESLTDDLITKYKLSEANKSYPIWSYTHDGASLLRMASESVGGTEKVCIDHVVRSTSLKSKGVKVFDLTPNVDGFPSVQELQESYASLRDLCSPSSNKDVWSGDLMWLSSLESTKWLTHISKFLSASKTVVHLIVDSKKTVVVKEPGGGDFTPLVSSLSQLMMEPKYRTIEGFQRLIDKEWIALGHRFCERLGFVSSKQKAPVFQAFLDCVWQLIQQFPHEFEFTTVYLTALYDSTFVGLFDAFIFDTPKHRMLHFHKNDKHANLAKGRLNKSSPALQSTIDVIKFSPPSPPSVSSKTRHFMTIWDWELQFNASNVGWFKNPLFYLFSSAVLRPSGDPTINNNTHEMTRNLSNDGQVNMKNCSFSFKNPSKKGFTNMFKSYGNSRASFPATHSIFYKSSLFQDEVAASEEENQLSASHSLSEVSSAKNSSSSSSLKLSQHPCIRVKVGVPHLKLWDHCYLRWISPLELIGGSQFAEYFTQIQLVLDIISLKKSISKTECQIHLMSSTDSEASRFSCEEMGSTPGSESTFEVQSEARTIENSSFYISNFLTEPENPPAKEQSHLADTTELLQEASLGDLHFPNPPECFTSSFPYAVERPPSSFATPMTFSSDSQRASYVDSDLASIDEMSNSIISNF